MFFGDAKQNYEQRLTVANIKPKLPNSLIFDSTETHLHWLPICIPLYTFQKSKTLLQSHKMVKIYCCQRVWDSLVLK